MTPAGFPHSEISGSKLVSSSPKLIAAYRVLHRLPMPRHPPLALNSLSKKLDQNLITVTPSFPVSFNCAKIPKDLHAQQYSSRKDLVLLYYSIIKDHSRPSFQRSSKLKTQSQTLFFITPNSQSLPLLCLWIHHLLQWWR